MTRCFLGPVKHALQPGNVKKEPLPESGRTEKQNAKMEPPAGEKPFEPDEDAPDTRIFMVKGIK